MADKRMFSKAIVESDAFLDMPSSTQNLYFHLGMNADDSGFVGNPKRIQRIIGASDDDMRILLAKRYLLSFDSGIVVIKHWYINNYIQSDRRKETTYIEEKNTLMLDSKKAYTERSKNVLDTTCIQNGYNLDTQNRLDENRLDENRLERDAHTDVCTHEQDYTSDLDFLPSQPSIQEIRDYIILKGYKFDAERFYNYYSAKGWKLGNTPIENWQILVDEWGRRESINNRAEQIAKDNINNQSYTQRETNGLKQREYSREELKGIFGNQNISDDDI